MKLQGLRNISIEVFQMNVINKDDNMILIYYSMRGFFLGAKCIRFLWNVTLYFYMDENSCRMMIDKHYNGIRMGLKG